MFFQALLRAIASREIKNREKEEAFEAQRRASEVSDGRLQAEAMRRRERRLAADPDAQRREDAARDALADIHARDAQRREDAREAQRRVDALQTPVEFDFLRLASPEQQADLQKLPEPLRSQLLKEGFFVGEDEAWELIPPAWVDAAFERWKSTPKPAKPMTSLGVEMAENRVTLARRHGTWFDALRVHEGIDTADGPRVAALVFSAMRDHCEVAIDLGGGWGRAAFDHLKAQNIAVTEASPAEAPYRRSGFPDMRSLMWWGFSEAMDPNGASRAFIALPPDPDLKADLTALTWQLTPSGVQVEGKEEARQRVGRSMDRAEAVVHAWSHGTAREADRIVRRQTTANVGYAGAKRYATAGSRR